MFTTCEIRVVVLAMLMMLVSHAREMVSVSSSSQPEEYRSKMVKVMSSPAVASKGSATILVLHLSLRRVEGTAVHPNVP